MKITPQILKSNGYQQYPAAPNVDFSYQKTIRDSSGKKLYFINVDFYLKNEYLTEDCINFHVRFYAEENSLGFDLKYHVESHHTLDEIEDFYAKSYQIFGCIPDIHNND